MEDQLKQDNTGGVWKGLQTIQGHKPTLRDPWGLGWVNNLKQLKLNLPYGTLKNDSILFYSLV